MFNLYGILVFASLAGLSWVQSTADLSPPTPSSGSPGTQFVAIARGEQVKLWDIRPERSEQREVCRQVLGSSPWTPTPLFESPAFLRWQVPGGDENGRHGYRVKVIKVDYPGFELTELLSAKWADSIARSSSSIFMKTPDGLCAVDLKTGSLSPQRPAFEFVAGHGDDWLVDLDGTLARFDAGSASITRRYPAISVTDDLYAWTLWDGGPVAIKLGGFMDEKGNPVKILEYEVWSIIYQELILWDLEAGAQRKLRVRTQAVGGSGVGVLPIAFEVEIEGDQLRYTERFHGKGAHANLSDFNAERDTEWVLVDLATGAELERLPHASFEGDLAGVCVDLPTIPAYLQELFEQSPIEVWGYEQDLAHAFLTHSGIELDLPTSGVCKLDAVCITPDGKELLVLNRGTFYHADLDTRELLQWAAAEKLSQRSVDLYAIDPGQR